VCSRPWKQGEKVKSKQKKNGKKKGGKAFTQTLGGVEEGGMVKKGAYLKKNG